MLRGLPSLSRSDWEHLIDEWILSERYRGILKRKILDDWSHERIAEREGLSVNGVKKIIAAVRECTAGTCNRAARIGRLLNIKFFRSY